MKAIEAGFLLLALALSPAAWAHSDEYLDTLKTPHGGQLRMAGAFHYELVVKPDAITVYVTDHADSKQDTKGASGTATVLSGRTKASIKLAPAGDNTLKGAGKFDLDPEMKVVVSITMAGKQPEQARFTPLKKATASQ
jgi:hypothetical protein